MRGNSFGKLFSLTSFGESHGPYMGVVIDGMISGVTVSIDDLQNELNRRRPAQGEDTSPRNEPDKVEIISGIFEGKTLGTPICCLVKNVDQRPQDYDHLKNTFRKGHADETTFLKYKIRDHRGGGRASGRETVARVIAGYFASLIIPLDFEVFADKEKDLLRIKVNNPPKGLGEPCFDKLKSDLAKAMLSIGGCTSFSYEGGIYGGMTDGTSFSLSMTFKRPSSKEGRHDKSLFPRVIPVAEAMLKITIADHFLRQNAYENFDNR